MELRIRSHLPSQFGMAAFGLTALLGVLAALLWTSDAPAAGRTKAPTVSSVSPSKAVVGDRLTIRGRNFRAGKGRNTVVFKRDGGRALFVKADLSTRKLIRVTVPARLETLLPLRDGARQYAQFRVRVIAGRLGRSFTPLTRSPRLGMPVAADGDCDRDGRTNRVDDDDDNDLLPDAVEARYHLLECDPDTDDDGVGDGYEFASARDLNDDEYQRGNTAIPYPASRPYPNPLDGKDAGTDFDGDSLTLAEEHALWRYSLTGRPRTGGTSLDDPAQLGRFELLDALSYSDGEQYSIRERCPSAANPGACGARDNGRRVPSLRAFGYTKRGEFLAWAQREGYRSVFLTHAPPWTDVATRNEYGLLDVNRSHPNPDPKDPWRGEVGSETLDYDLDGDRFLSDDERDEDADGLTNFDETHGRMLPSYWTACYVAETAYPRAYAGTNAVDPDTDGDEIRDGADDQDHDAVPNIMELSRIAASGLDDRADPSKAGCKPRPGIPTESHHASAYGRVNPFNPCLPMGDDPSVSRTCQRAPDFAKPPAPFDGSPDWHALQ